MEPTELVEREIAAVNDQDADAFARGFAEDATFVTILEQRMTGRDDAAAGHVVLFTTLLTGTGQRSRTLTSQALSPDLVLLHAEWDRERPEKCGNPQRCRRAREG